MIKVFEKTVMRDSNYISIGGLLEVIDNCILVTDGLKLIIDKSNSKDRRKINEASALLSSARGILSELNMQL